PQKEVKRKMETGTKQLRVRQDGNLAQKARPSQIHRVTTLARALPHRIQLNPTKSGYQNKRLSSAFMWLKPPMKTKNYQTNPFGIFHFAREYIGLLPSTARNGKKRTHFTANDLLPSRQPCLLVKALSVR